MGQFRDISIKNIVDELNTSYFLPDIQREFVWLNKSKEKKIEQLFDSILRGYPIGSFLFWKLKKNDIETNRNALESSDKLNFQLYKFIENYDERLSHNIKIHIDQINADDLSIVLDGQQRLTSLYIGLKGTRTLKKPKAWWDNPNAFEEKSLYLNLRYSPEEENPDDNYKFEFLNNEMISEPDPSNYWFKVGNILELPSIVTYSRENDLNDVEAEILERLKNAICTKNLISFFEEQEKNLDKVLKIFIRVNSGGTQLSYSDLLMSIITANFSSDIRDLMNIFIDSLRDKGFGVIGRDQILKTCLFLTNSNHIFQLKNFSKVNIHKIESEWDKITISIFKSVKLLQEFGFENRLSSAYIMTALAYYIHNKNTINEEDKEEMLIFVRNTQITSYFTTSLDGKLEVVGKILKDSHSFKDVNKKLKNSKVQPLRITKDDVEQMLFFQYGNPATLPVLQILYPNLDYKNSTFHIDHIYPKSKFNKNNNSLPEEYTGNANFLYNLQLLEGDENIQKRDKDPEIWINTNFQNTERKLLYKKNNYIDEEFELDWNAIKEFDEMRSKNILIKLHEVFN